MNARTVQALGVEKSLVAMYVGAPLQKKKTGNKNTTVWVW